MDIIAGFNSGNVDQIQQRLAPQQNRFHGEGGFLSGFVDVAELKGAFQAGFKVTMEVNNLQAAVYGDSAITTFFERTTIMPSQWTTAHGRPVEEFILLEQTRPRLETGSCASVAIGRSNDYGKATAKIRLSRKDIGATVCP